jgi:hypothetical protein
MTQLAGRDCACCTQIIKFDNEGTYCGHCGTTFHQLCLELHANLCSSCNQLVPDPSVFFVYSQKCPGCWKKNVAPQDRCVRCGTVTRWKTPADWKAFLTNIRRDALDLLASGFIILAASSFLVVLIGPQVLVLGFAGPIGLYFLLPLAASISLSAVGIGLVLGLRRLARGIQLLTFR